MAWFSREKAPKPIDVADKLQLPDDIWTKCPECDSIIFTKDLKRSFGICTKCNYHFRLSARQRVPLLTDRHSFDEIDINLRSVDPLEFRDTKRYSERL